MEKLHIERAIWIDAPRGKVWRAVTDPAQLEQWYVPGCAWEIPDLHIGAPVKFHNAPDDILGATIAAVYPPQRFALRWQPDADYPDAPLVMQFLLHEEDGGTRAVISTAVCDRLTVGALAGTAAYERSLNGLKTLLEQSEIG